MCFFFFFFFSSRRRHTRSLCDWSSDVCSSDLCPPLPTAGEPEPVGGGAADADRGTERGGERCLGLGAPRTQPGRGRDQLHRGVADPPARARYHLAHVLQDGHPGGARPARVVGAEEGADVAETGRGQDGVGERVRYHVAVGVPGAAVVPRPVQPGQPAGAARLDGVDVGADADPGQPVAHWRTCSSATARSWATVILAARSCPSTVATGMPAARTTAASSVKPGASARRSIAEYAETSVARWKPCGVCTRRSDSRGTASMITPSSPTTTVVSTTGSTGTTARAPFRRAASTRETTTGGVSGRAASCTRTTSA